MYVTISHGNAQPFAPSKLAARKTPLKTLKKGAYLYFEGDDVTHLFIIETGVVRLTRVLEDGRRQVIAFGYPGDIIGFPAQDTHHTDCDALCDTKLCSIPRKVLEDSSADPDLHSVLIQAALQEISAMQDHFMMLGRKSAPEKVASFLTVLLERIGDTSVEPQVLALPMSRSDIADFLGLTTETVCRCLTALRKAEIIRIDGISKVAVLDQSALAQRADGQLN
ncbi:cyclic nucleotide-binding domain-containing protein [Pseudaestuariivita atlantica]|uniref:Transcriptional regulator n=1 Tax=Pseudaestuariivita atlantica TaxID=1317121 RepID=A0A0L1JJC4_9RHOB|nr:cyclic nucleotide-binding domain-containing protein [Pseudaestuariivita atlantica]KNG91870.1 transcriptional regulator [Pseudaestuariivita atlantica]